MDASAARLRCFIIASKIERDANQVGDTANAIARWVCAEPGEIALRLDCCEAVLACGLLPKSLAGYLQVSENLLRFAFAKTEDTLASAPPKEEVRPQEEPTPSIKRRIGRRKARKSGSD